MKYLDGVLLSNPETKKIMSKGWNVYHSSRALAYQKTYRNNKKEKIRLYALSYRRSHRRIGETIKQRGASCAWNRMIMKWRFLLMYGSSCSLCGYSCAPALTIDHINGDGRFEINKKGHFTRSCGTALYNAVRSYQPLKYRVLCMNCQLIEKKRLYEQLRIARGRIFWTKKYPKEVRVEETRGLPGEVVL